MKRYDVCYYENLQSRGVTHGGGAKGMPLAVAKKYADEWARDGAIGCVVDVVLRDGSGSVVYTTGRRS